MIFLNLIDLNIAREREKVKTNIELANKNMAAELLFFILIKFVRKKINSKISRDLLTKICNSLNKIYIM